MAKRFGCKTHFPVVELIKHYEVVEELAKVLPPNMVARATMLPERVVHLLNHYEAVEQLRGVVPSNIVTRVTMLPEGVVGRWFKLLMEKYPDKYPTQEVLGERFGISQDLVSLLILHYQAIEQLKSAVPPNITTRVVMSLVGVAF